MVGLMGELGLGLAVKYFMLESLIGNTHVLP